MKRAVLDAGALTALYENEPGAAQVASLIQLAGDRRCSLAMSVVNWGEVYYVIWNGRGPGVARHVIEEIAHLPLSIVPPGLEQTRLATELQAEHKLPLRRLLRSLPRPSSTRHSRHRRLRFLPPQEKTPSLLLLS